MESRDREIESVRLDTLIARFGVPAFVKMDVEGAELRVLYGLTQALPALSFEYLPTALPEARACLARVLELGPYRFNLSVGESYRLISTSWLAAEEVSAVLATPRCSVAREMSMLALRPRDDGARFSALDVASYYDGRVARLASEACRAAVEPYGYCRDHFHSSGGSPGGCRPSIRCCSPMSSGFML